MTFELERLLSAETYERLRAEAERQNTPIESLVREVIEKYAGQTDEGIELESTSVEIDKALEEFANSLDVKPTLVGVLDYTHDSFRDITLFDYRWPNRSNIPPVGFTSKVLLLNAVEMAETMGIGTLQQSIHVATTGVVVIVHAMRWIVLVEYSNALITSLDALLDDIVQKHLIVTEAVAQYSNRS